MVNPLLTTFLFFQLFNPLFSLFTLDAVSPYTSGFSDIVHFFICAFPDASGHYGCRCMESLTNFLRHPLAGSWGTPVYPFDRRLVLSRSPPQSTTKDIIISLRPRVPPSFFCGFPRNVSDFLRPPLTSRA